MHDKNGSQIRWKNLSYDINRMHKRGLTCLHDSWHVLCMQHSSILQTHSRLRLIDGKRLFYRQLEIPRKCCHAYRNFGQAWRLGLRIVGLLGWPRAAKKLFRNCFVSVSHPQKHWATKLFCFYTCTHCNETVAHSLIRSLNACRMVIGNYFCACINTAEIATWSYFSRVVLLDFRVTYFCTVVNKISLPTRCV